MTLRTSTTMVAVLLAVLATGACRPPRRQAVQAKAAPAVETVASSVSDVATGGSWEDYYRYDPEQVGNGNVVPSVELLRIVPELRLTGSIGSQVRVDAINQFGPVDAWFTLATVNLTNTTQLHFDITAPGQPPRLYRLVPVP